MSSPSTEFLLAFAQGLAWIVAIAASALGFLVGRAVARRRTGDRVYEAHLAGIAVTGVYLVISASLGWWAWCEAANGSAPLLFGLATEIWLWILFAPLVLLGAASAIVSGSALVVRLSRSRRAQWDP